MQRDRFELLSAYIDHEVTADERRQVEAWMAEDAEFAMMHRRLVKMQRGFQSLPTPVAAEHVDITISQVLNQVDRPRPSWKVLVGGGAVVAAAAAAIAVLPGLFTPSPSPQFARQTEVAPTNTIETPTPAAVLVSLDQPTFVPLKKATSDQ